MDCGGYLPRRTNAHAMKTVDLRDPERIAAERRGGWSFKRDWGFLVPAILLSLMMLASATFYFAQAEEVTAEFVKLGFPAWVRPLLAVAKVIGIALLWLSPSAPLRHFAYAGFLFNFVLATLAHGYAGDGEWVGGLVALALLALAMWRDPRG